MIEISRGDLLILAVALSAYLAGLRTYTLDQLASRSMAPTMEKKLRKLILLVSIADALLIFSAAFLVADYIFGGIALFYRIAMLLFCLGMFTILVIHFQEWLKSYKEYRNVK